MWTAAQMVIIPVAQHVYNVLYDVKLAPRLIFELLVLVKINMLIMVLDYD